jgi:hypothetical protein
MTTWTTEDLENAKKKIEEDEYSGGIPIPFAGWVQQDKEDTELTDEQINWFAKAYTDRNNKLNIIDFARAILRKAQEK